MHVSQFNFLQLWPCVMIESYTYQIDLYALHCMLLHNNDEIALHVDHFTLRLSSFVVHGKYS
jgi:hypothetical protein